jgi:Zn-dependent protease/CBS domain-containing protein
VLTLPPPRSGHISRSAAGASFLPRGPQPRGMRRFRIGSAFGIPLQLDITFLLVLPLFAWIIGSEVERTVELLNRVGPAALDASMLSTGYLPWVLGTAAALGLFVGVVLHELGHSVVAQRFGFPIASITLWLFGGIAQLEEMPEDWRQELLIAIAGPIVSVALGVLCYAAYAVAPATGNVAVEGLRFVVGYLAVVNLALAVFNMLPGFPMDGGRVLRALLARTRPYARATEIAAEVGKAFAVVLALFGLFVVFNLFLVGLAFFIYIGAAAESRRTMMEAAFEGVTVADVMTPREQVSTVHAEDSVANLFGTMFRERHTGYPVVENGHVIGVVTLDDARSVKEVERDAFTVRDVMSTDLETVAPDASVMEALTDLEQRGVGRLVVMDGDELQGILTRTDVMTALSIIQSSGDFDASAISPRFQAER